MSAIMTTFDVKKMKSMCGTGYLWPLEVTTAKGRNGSSCTRSRIRSTFTRAVSSRTFNLSTTGKGFVFVLTSEASNVKCIYAAHLNRHHESKCPLVTRGPLPEIGKGTERRRFYLD